MQGGIVQPGGFRREDGSADHCIFVDHADLVAKTTGAEESNLLLVETHFLGAGNDSESKSRFNPLTLPVEPKTESNRIQLIQQADIGTGEEDQVAPPGACDLLGRRYLDTVPRKIALWSGTDIFSNG